MIRSVQTSALVAALAVGCSGSRAVKTEAHISHATACEEKGTLIILKAQSCAEARYLLQNLVASDGDCRDTFGDAGRVELTCDGGLL